LDVISHPTREEDIVQTREEDIVHGWMSCLIQQEKKIQFMVGCHVPSNKKREKI